MPPTSPTDRTGSLPIPLSLAPNIGVRFFYFSDRDGSGPHAIITEWIRGGPGERLVSTRKRPLSKDEIARTAGTEAPAILNPTQLASLLGISPKTIYEWIAKGRLDGAFRKRGKHVLIWRDRALDILFNGKEWTDA